MAVQSHPMSLILAPIESVYATSYWSSIVTMVLPCPVSEILQVSGEQRPHPYSTRILGVFPLDQIADVVPPSLSPRSEDPKLIIRVINFELVQPICPAYINVTDRRTDDLRQQYRALHYVHHAVKIKAINNLLNLLSLARYKCLSQCIKSKCSYINITKRTPGRYVGDADVTITTLRVRRYFITLVTFVTSDSLG